MKLLLIAFITWFSILPTQASFDELVRTGDVHDRKFQCDEALKYYLPAVKLQPKNAGLLVKISRQYALRMSDLKKDAEKIASGRTALSYAERAVAAAPDKCDPHLSVAICLGKLTPFLGNRESIESSRQIKISAERAVQLDPKNDFAWHVLGRWHQSLANIGTATRALAGVIYGKIPAASNETAVDCFKKAIALNPRRLIHVVELGRTYAMMDQREESLKYLKKGLAMPESDKDDPETKRRGRTTLKEIS